MKLSKTALLILAAFSANAMAAGISADNENLVVTNGTIDATGNNIGVNAIQGYSVTVEDSVIDIKSSLRGVQTQNSTITIGTDSTESVSILAQTTAEYNPSGTAMGMFVNTSVGDNVAASGSTGIVNINGRDISITAVSYGSAAEGFRAQGGIVNIGSDQTERIAITATGADSANTMGVFAFQSQVALQAKEVSVTSDGAYGILAQNNSEQEQAPENTAHITIDADNTVITNTAEEGAGIMAYSNGRVDITGNLTVTAASAIDTRGNATININQDGQGTVVLNGDIVFETPGPSGNSGNVINSNVNINLTGENSSWTGTTVKLYPTANKDNTDYTTVDGFALTLADGAQWNATTYKGTVPDTGTLEDTPVNNLTLDGGVINATETSQTVQVEKLTVTSKGGEFNAVTTAEEDGHLTSSKLSVQTVGEGSSALTVNYTGITSDEITAENASDLAAVSTDGLATTEVVQEGNINGQWVRSTDAEGNVTTSQASNTKLEAFKGVNASALVQWRNQINHLTKRLGDVRQQPGDIGAWARVYGGEYKWGDANQVDMKSTTVQVGGDGRIGDWIVGGAFSYTDSSFDLDNGDGNGDMYSLAVYGTRMFDSGAYVDLVARYGYLKNDLTAGNMDVDFTSNAFSASVESGHQFKFMDRAYVEPQIEITYGYAQGDNATASNGVKIDQDDFQSLVTRVGFRTGYDFPENAGTIYAHVSYSYDFLGDADGTATQGANRASLDQDLGGGWVTYGIGGQFKLGESTFAYADLERTTGGDVENPWAFNVGFRHLF